MDVMMFRDLWQRWRLRGTRLGRLLARRHVDVGLYLRSTPAAAVSAQIDACRRCDSAERCEQALRSLAAGRSNYPFCPNHDAIAPLFDSTGIRWHPRR